MTNNEIILTAAIEAGLVSAYDKEKYLHYGTMPAIHTYKYWQDLGYQVKKGEKAALKVQLWKVRSLKKEEREEAERTGVMPKAKMFLANAALFTFNQVEKIEDEPENMEETAQNITSEPAIISTGSTYMTAQGNIIAQTRQLELAY